VKGLKIYYAGCENKTNWKILVKEHAENFIVSFYYIKKYNVNIHEFLKQFEYKVNIILDPGSFSSDKKDEINPIEYGNYILENIDCFDFYLNCDVIGNIDETLKNQKLLESMGLRPIPVFHYTDDFETNGSMNILEDYCKNHDRVALGGSASKGGKINPAWHVKCFEIVEKYEIKTHACGVMSTKILEMFPWASTDSSNWISSRGEFFIPKHNALLRLNWRTQRGKIMPNVDYIEAMGFSIKELHDREVRQRINIRSFRWYQEYLKNKRCKK